MPDIPALLRELAALEVDDAPLLTASLDLTPGGDGIPSAITVLKQAWRDIEDGYEGELQRRPLKRSYEADRAALEALVSAATDRGVKGLYFASCDAIDYRTAVETPYPLRNSLHLGRHAWLFELQRYAYLHGRGAVLVLAGLRDFRALKIEGGEVVAETATERWEGAATGPHGRTDTQGVGSPGSDGGGAAPSSTRGIGAGADSTGGWHGKTRIEKSVLAHQEGFAREDAATVESLASNGDLIVVSGPDEPRAELMRQLSEQHRAAAIELPAIAPTASDRDLIDAVTDIVVERRRRDAEEQLEAWASGDLGAHAIGGIDAVLKAIELGQLATLLLTDDVAPTLGTASDARPTEVTLDASELVNDAIRGALATSADCVIVPSASDVLTDGAAGILRWI